MRVERPSGPDVVTGGKTVRRGGSEGFRRGRLRLPAKTGVRTIGGIDP
jgi:hypothetical protein